MSRKPRSVRSSGNVFEDLGFDQAEAKALLLRADLMFEVAEELRRQEKTQKELGDILGIGQSRVSDLMKGKAKLFSLDMLVTLAQRLGMRVSLDVGAAATRRTGTVTASLPSSASAGTYYWTAGGVTGSGTNLESAPEEQATTAPTEFEYFRSNGTTGNRVLVVPASI